MYVHFFQLSFLISAHGRLLSVEKIAKDGLDQKTINENYILHDTCLQGNLDGVKALLEYGINVNSKNKDARTPLENAATAGNVEIINILVEHGAGIPPPFFFILISFILRFLSFNPLSLEFATPRFFILFWEPPPLYYVE